MASTTSTMSKDFLELVRAIGEAKSKQEEDRIIIAESRVLKAKMGETNVSGKKMKEYLVRALYCEMLGHEVEFAYIKAVNATHSNNIMEKRVGYLAVGLCLHEDHELMILLVNTIQRDLKSANYLEACAALTAVCKLMNEETIPAVLPLIVELLGHQQQIVRKKAVMALHRFYSKSKSSVSHLQEKFRRALCDKDPSVMAASLCIFRDLIAEDPSAFKDLIPSFVSILKQITEHRLSREYDYHRIPAPWTQVKILKVLALLGADDQRASEGMYEILHEVMKRADTGINAGYAVVYETVRTIAAIYPNPQLLEAAATSITRFITSENHNLKYLGITALGGIVAVDRKYAAEHQMAVIECLEDPDETLKRKTLDLLYSITTPGNVTVITDKMLTFLRGSVDVHLRKDLVSRVVQLAERYAPSNEWYLDTMNTVYELGGDLVREETAHNLMRLVAEGSGEDEDLDTELKINAVATYADMLTTQQLPTVLVHIIAWVCGEYAALSDEVPEEDILSRLCDLLERQHDDAFSRGYIVTALAKTVARLAECPVEIEELLEKYSSSRNLDLQQRCCEIRELCKNMGTMSTVLPFDGSAEDLELDPELPFLNGFVQHALSNGAKEYIPEEDREDFGISAVSVDAPAGGLAGGLKIDAYDAPTVGSRKIGEHLDEAAIERLASGAGAGGDPSAAAAGHGAAGDAPADDSSSGIRLGNTERKWGRKGYKTTDQEQAPPAPAPYGQEAQQAQQAAHQAEAAAIFGGGPAAAPAQQAPQEGLNTGNNPGSFDQRRNRSESFTEKEKLANALFGGDGGASSAGAAGRAGRRTAASRRANRTAGAGGASAPAAAAPASSNDMLVDLMGDPLPASPATSTASAPAPAADPLFDLLSGPTPASPAASASGTPSLDPFGDLTGGAPAASQPQSGPNYDSLRTAPAPAADPLADLFGGGMAAMPAPVPAGPMLAPALIDVNTFGANWNSLLAERKAPVMPSAVTSPAEFSARLQRANVHPVQTIGNEVIGAAKANNQFVLVHGKCTGAALELTIRTGDKALSESTFNAVAAAMR